jgi:hypothetical protein
LVVLIYIGFLYKFKWSEDIYSMLSKYLKKWAKFFFGN